MSFASFQAIAGYAYSALFAASGGHYGVLFAVAATAVVLALLVDMLVRDNQAMSLMANSSAR
ncbi:hypothetical protein HG549_25100 [Pseudomonas sp. SK]|nr:hypothetical protein HG549_25100 [Pseudomonas sp. SK]